ncbi:MAG TPA: Fe-S cluster assembly protein SufB, partial [Actinomycetota bacterium]|nr:Fe-S cluster assembly protein SufB [Actinomycetota bacterium]
MATEAEDLKVQQENEEVRALKGDYKYGWHDATSYDEAPTKGLNHQVLDMMSDRKNEPDWMRKFRHKALDVFYRKPMPTWGADLSGIDFDDIYYYIKPMNQVKSWDDMPEDIKSTWDKLGIPEAEKKYLGGVTAQYESEVVYHKTQEHLERQGILFSDMDTAVREHPEIVKQYFGTIIPPADNKFAALNSAVWSGGSFIYVPPGVEVEIPLQAYF